MHDCFQKSKMKKELSQQIKPSFGPLILMHKWISNTNEWIKSGEAPPKKQHGSLVLALVLFFIGLSTTAVWFLATFHIKFDDVLVTVNPLLFVSFITLCPSLYAGWVSICCWRKVYGYDWNMIPDWE